MIDPPWFKPAIPPLRLAETRAEQLRRAILRDPLVAFLRTGEMRPLILPRLTGQDPHRGAENLDR
jgi:hypothetical protein